MPEWKQEEKICYTAHIWADKEKLYQELQDFDYSEMAKTVFQFIACQPPNTDFNNHIENCFYLLHKTDYDIPDWTKENFNVLYSANIIK